MAETESCDNDDDYEGSFRYKYSIDSNGKKTLESKLTIKGEKSLTSRGLSIKKKAQSPAKINSIISGKKSFILNEEQKLDSFKLPLLTG